MYLRGGAVTAPLAALLVCALARPAPADDDEPAVDLDGDGDIDAADRALLDAAETIEVVDQSAGALLEESSRAVTVVDLADARERAADLGEVLSRAHGVQVRRGGGLGSETRFSLNGLYDDQIRVFIDGIPLALTGGSLGIADFPTELVHRVDVYRGVVPISLGADALGGAIDLVTDPSWTDRASLGYQVGSFGTHRAALSARARDRGTGLALGIYTFADRARNDYAVDVEVADERGQVRPATVRRFHDGYTAGGAIVEAGVVSRGVLERALVRVFAAQTAKELQHNFVMTVPYGEAYYDTIGRGASLELALRAGPWRARLVAGVSRTTTDFTDLASQIYDWYGRVVGQRSFGGEIGDPVHQRLVERGAFARATAERSFGAHTLRLALAPTAYLRSGRDWLDENPAGRDPIEARRDVAQLVAGAEHEVRTGRLENTAFAKYYLLASEVERVELGYMFVPASTRLHHAGLGDSARYRLSRHAFVKASYEWATRLPTPDELFGDGVLVEANLDLRPETSHNANLALHAERETRWGAWGGEVASFARLAEDFIVPIGSDRSQRNHNVYGARILGLEGMLGYAAPRELLRAELNATLQDLRNSSPDGPFGQFDGDRLPNRPWLLGSLQLSTSRRRLLHPRDHVTLFATSRYVHAFFRGWESLGTRESKQVIPSQLIHGAGVTYAIRAATEVVTTIEFQNVTDARTFDSFGVQRPGRAVFLKLSTEL